MTRALTFTLFCLTIADVIVLYFGVLMLGFAGEGARPGAPKPLLFWLFALIPLAAVLAPAMAWLAPWPLTTPLRRTFTCALPVFYVVALMTTISALA
jgi:hypothetical protein